VPRSPHATTRKTGRPARGDDVIRHNELLDAALQAFLLNGLAGTSLDDIASLAHVAKRTIYQKFNGKEGLFAACIERAAFGLVKEFPSLDKTSDDLHNDLTSIGCAVLTFVLNPHSLSIYRLVLGESARQPALANIFYRNGPGQIIASIATLLESSFGKEDLSQEESLKLAQEFVGLVVLEIQQRAVLGQLTSMNQAEIKAHVIWKVNKFLAMLSE